MVKTKGLLRGLAAALTNLRAWSGWNRQTGLRPLIFKRVQPAFFFIVRS